jgi:hypothetical protein
MGFALWQWLYNNTQHRNRAHHIKTAPRSNKTAQTEHTMNTMHIGFTIQFCYQTLATLQHSGFMGR